MAMQLTNAHDSALPIEEQTAAKDTVALKWQGAVTEGSGFVAIPLALLRLQREYSLSATDMLVLINLLAHWWSPDSSVFPRNSIIARRMGVDSRTVQRSTKKLVDAGLMRRVTAPDGKRVFTFDTLAKRVARDVSKSFELQLAERALL
jgi:DNA-binding MarR family transcriptional regulator